jgi:hypothetical protein
VCSTTPVALITGRRLGSARRAASAATAAGARPAATSAAVAPRASAARATATASRAAARTAHAGASPAAAAACASVCTAGNTRRASSGLVTAAAYQGAAPEYAGAVNVYAVSALLAALLILAIGASVILRSRDRIHTSFAAFSFTVAAWHLCGFFAAATGSPLMAWLTLWAAATIPPTAIAFFRVFLAQPSIGGHRRGPRVTLAWTLLAYVALVYSALVDQIHDKWWFELPLGAYVFGGLYRCVYDLFMQYRATVKRVERIRVGYLTLGGFVATTLALTELLPRFGVLWPTVGNALGILYLYFLSQTLFRSRLLDLNELIGKMVVLGTLVALLAMVYGVLLYWIGGGQKGLYLLNALVASFVILILFEPVRTRLEGGVNRWILRTRHELRGRLDAVRRDLPAVVDVNEMVTRVVTALEESRRMTDASIYLLDAEGGGFDRAGYFGTAPIERLDAAADRALLDRIRGGPLDLEVLTREAAAAAAAEPPNASAAQLAALVARADELRAGAGVSVARERRDRARPVAARDAGGARRPRARLVRPRRCRHVPPAGQHRRQRDRVEPGVRARQGA